jgi:hypothetical protein
VDTPVQQQVQHWQRIELKADMNSVMLEISGQPVNCLLDTSMKLLNGTHQKICGRHEFSIFAHQNVGRASSPAAFDFDLMFRR